MIRVTGDTHGDVSRFVNGNMDDATWGEEDYLIVCGDFGYVFIGGEEDELKLDVLESKPYTICFCDGNHENFPLLYSYPKEKWNGGTVHRIRKNIVHLMRGQVYEIDSKKIFTMGGAYSIDRYVRTLGLSYWEEELPCNDEYREAIQNLTEHGKSVDYIITHTAPREIIRRMGKYPDPHDMELTGFLEWIMYTVSYKHWYFGHWHTDCCYPHNFTAVYFDIHTLDQPL